MQKAFQLFTLAIALLLVGVMSGCAFPRVHKIDVQQGNIITQDMVDQLKPGMTTRQVRFILGEPIVQGTFHPGRWDYYYHLTKASGEQLQERLSIFFEDDKMTHFSGDFLPASAQSITLK